MKRSVLILLGIFISYCVDVVLATTYYVNPGESIQTAIDSASYLDTVQVAAGTYIENITLKNGVALVGAGAASTTIDPNDGTVIMAAGCDPNTRLSGFTITGAAGATYGGGMSNVYSSVIITNCAFIGNSATFGGAMRNLRSDPNVINCIFSGNSADMGGAMHNIQSSSPTITNCTFSGNVATNTYGGAMRNHNSTAKITNCIFWQNTAATADDEISNSGSTPIISHSDIAGCGGSAGWDTSFGTDGGGNIDLDPMFVLDPNAGGDGWGDDPCTPADESANDEYGDLHLAVGSPCIDAGNNSALIANPVDPDGYPRTIDGNCDEVVVVDIGAHEFNYAYLGDFDFQCDVDYADFAILSTVWLTDSVDLSFNALYDISEPADDLVDIEDAKVFVENWLQSF